MSERREDIDVGTVMVVKDVNPYCPSKEEFYLNIVPKCIMTIHPHNTQIPDEYKEIIETADKNYAISRKQRSVSNSSKRRSSEGSRVQNVPPVKKRKLQEDSLKDSMDIEERPPVKGNFSSPRIPQVRERKKKVFDKPKPRIQKQNKMSQNKFGGRRNQPPGGFGNSSLSQNKFTGPKQPSKAIQKKRVPERNFFRRKDSFPKQKNGLSQNKFSRRSQQKGNLFSQKKISQKQPFFNNRNEGVSKPRKLSSDEDQDMDDFPEF